MLCAPPLLGAGTAARSCGGATIASASTRRTAGERLAGSGEAVAALPGADGVAACPAGSSGDSEGMGSSLGCTPPQLLPPGEAAAAAAAAAAPPAPTESRACCAASAASRWCSSAAQACSLACCPARCASLSRSMSPMLCISRSSSEGSPAASAPTLPRPAEWLGLWLVCRAGSRAPAPLAGDVRGRSRWLLAGEAACCCCISLKAPADSSTDSRRRSSALRPPSVRAATADGGSTCCRCIFSSLCCGQEDWHSAVRGRDLASVLKTAQLAAQIKQQRLNRLPLRLALPQLCQRHPHALAQQHTCSRSMMRFFSASSSTSAALLLPDRMSSIRPAARSALLLMARRTPPVPPPPPPATPAVPLLTAGT